MANYIENVHKVEYWLKFKVFENEKYKKDSFPQLNKVRGFVNAGFKKLKSHLSNYLNLFSTPLNNPDLKWQNLALIGSFLNIIQDQALAWLNWFSILLKLLFRLKILNFDNHFT